MSEAQNHRRQATYTLTFNICLVWFLDEALARKVAMLATPTCIRDVNLTQLWGRLRCIAFHMLKSKRGLDESRGFFFCCSLEGARVNKIKIVVTLQLAAKGRQDSAPNPAPLFTQLPSPNPWQLYSYQTYYTRQDVLLMWKGSITSLKIKRRFIIYYCQKKDLVFEGSEENIWWQPNEIGQLRNADLIF